MVNVSKPPVVVIHTPLTCFPTIWQSQHVNNNDTQNNYLSAHDVEQCSVRGPIRELQAVGTARHVDAACYIYCYIYIVYIYIYILYIYIVIYILLYIYCYIYIYMCVCVL